MKTKLLTALIVLLMLGGTGLIAYPTVSDWWNQFHTTRAVAAYDNVLAGMTDEEIDAMLAEAEAFNARLRREPDRWHLPEEMSAEYYSIMDISGTGIMGVVAIPSLGVELPIYHGDDESVLQTATGHVEGSTFPVGSTGGHAVVSGHTGLASARLFDKIDQLAIGDKFVVSVAGRELLYRVCAVNVVLPYEMDYLAIDPDRDLVTLLTCTPYGVNTHRLLVTGERMEFDDRRDELLEIEREKADIDEGVPPTAWLAAGGAAFVVACWAARPRRKKK